MRKKPYTAIGVTRVPCSFHGCKKTSVHQWQCCALGNYFMGLCSEHDIGLNNVAVTYLMGANRAMPLIRRYRKKLLA